MASSITAVQQFFNKHHHRIEQGEIATHSLEHIFEAAALGLNQLHGEEVPAAALFEKLAGLTSCVVTSLRFLDATAHACDLPKAYEARKQNDSTENRWRLGVDVAGTLFGACLLLRVARDGISFVHGLSPWQFSDWRVVQWSDALVTHSERLTFLGHQAAIVGLCSSRLPEETKKVWGVPTRRVEKNANQLQLEGTALDIASHVAAWYLVGEGWLTLSGGLFAHGLLGTASSLEHTAAHHDENQDKKK